MLNKVYLLTYLHKKSGAFISSSNICFGYLLEPPQRVDSNTYQKHMIYEEIRKKNKAFLSFFPVLPFYYQKSTVIQ